MTDQADDMNGRGWGLAIVLGIVALVAGALAFAPRVAELDVPSFVDRYGALGMGAALGFGLTGAAIVSARPDHRMGWLMTAIGTAQAMALFLQEYAIVAIHEPDSGLFGGGWALAIASALWAPAFIAVPTLFLLLFPDGYLPSRRWRVVAGAAFTAMTLAALGWFLIPPEMNDVDLYPPGYEPPTPTWSQADVLTDLAGVIAIPTVLASIASLVLRYRRADRRQRTQLGWILVGALLTIVLIVGGFTMGDAAPGVAAIATLPLPVTVAIVIGQHGLWDSDGLLRRTLAAGALSGVLLIVYVSIVGLAGALFERTTGASLLATGVIALLVLPAHQRATKWANRVVYGIAEDPATVLRRLGRELDSTARQDEVMASVCTTIAEAIGATYVAVILDGEPIAAVGSDGEAHRTVALTYSGETIGELVLGGLSDPDRLATRRLLDDLVPHVALAAHAQLLEREVTRRRARLLAAREEERRRLQRDLHDGVGPMMAAMALELDRGRLLFAHDPASGEAVLDQLSGHLREAVRAVRTLVHDLRPPPLDELGLVGALEVLGRQLAPTRPDVEVLELGLDREIPADVELAAYRIVSEALTNVVRHAGAEHCEVSVVGDEDQLVITVRDDGLGFGDDCHDGTGRRSMAARAEELGGTVRIESGHRGTTVTATLPFSSGRTL